jgi:hypothetical protein
MTNISEERFSPLQIVVVPDGETEEKVPAVPGLLEYRKDNKKLYVRENDTWEVIAQEKKVFGN